ncbi:MAG: hypothetical protein RXP99_06115 [Vulcanisaeta sp.]|jgi:hypothetical protein|nr:hypothetical protein [Vulcanisaeta sp.]MCG2894825.1 hypothetical protein [Vulcanisaeta sp.]
MVRSMASSLQRELKVMVDGILKGLETKSLRYTRVSVRDTGQVFEVGIKIYLESPMRFSTISEIIKALSSKYNVQPSDILIYAPHARAVKLLFTLRK